MMKPRFIQNLLCSSALVLASLATPAMAELGEVEHAPAQSFSGAYLAGDVARQDSDFSSAARYFSEALQFDPGNRLVERELLIALLTDGQFDRAISVASRLLDQPNIRRMAYITLGIDALRDEDFERAEELLTLDVASDLERLLTGIMRGWSISARGETDQALESIAALEGPEWYELFVTYHSGLMSLVADRPEQAATYFDAALDNQAGGGASPLTYLRVAQARARLAANQGDVDAALLALDQGLAMAPTNPVLLTLREQIEEPESSQAFVADALEGSAEILLNLGSAINRDGAEAIAALYLELARALASDNDNVLFELGSIAERLEQPLKAIEYYDQVPDDSALKRIAALQQGLNLADLERTEEAIATLEELIAANPSDYRGYLALGGVHASEQNFAEAALVYEEALKHVDNDEPTYWPLHYRLGIAYERTKQWEKAEPVFLKTLELSPDQPDVLNYLGYSWVDMNMNLEEGIEMIRTAVELRPRSGYIVDSLGWAYYRLGNFENAVMHLERAADLEPRDPTINDHLGDAYWRVGRKLEATYQWSTSLAFDPEDELRTKIEDKLLAANAPGMEPEIATSIVDDPTKQAENATSNGDGG